MEQTQVHDGAGVQEFLGSLKQSQLLSPEEIDRAIAAAGDSAISAATFAQWLIHAGTLTAYQIDAVCSQNISTLRIGNYDVLDRLGAGGMGTVFKARHRRMKRIVALKVLAGNLAKDAAFVSRFQREVETIARLSHPNIVMAFDADEDTVGHFLVMEFVDGKDLASLVQTGGPLGVSAAVRAILHAARGLEYAHAQQIIHRDIKPANLLMDAAGLVKVTDLGLARLNRTGGDTSGTITQAGGVVGTVDYMSPEQAVDSTVIDHRADIYSLGATLHFVLIGQPPFLGQTMMATLLKHREAPIPSLTAARSEVPAALDAIFARMLAKDPADRYQTMSEIVLALESLRAGLPVGTDFPVGQPVASRAPSAAQESRAPGAEDRTVAMQRGVLPPGIPAKVLLVEPSRTQAGIIRKYLQAAGSETATVATGQDALEAIRRDRPDAIVCAMYLADVTGVQLAQQVRAELQQASPGFVLISSEGEASEAGSLSKCGKAALLHKPFTPEKLIEAMRLVFNGSGTAPAPAAWRILIVDDSAAARMHERKVLEDLGLRNLVEAGDGAQAVAALARESFDLIVTDYNMPFMDGGQLVAYLKQNPATAATPIILVTTEQDPAKLDAVRKLGVAAICDKSFARDMVADILAQVVKSS